MYLQRALSILFTVLMAASAQAPQRRIKIMLAGDSTVENAGGWGPGFEASFGPEVEVMNFARGGRSSKSFRDEGLWAPVLAAKPDYVLLQFGHNDSPGKGSERETAPETTYRANMARYVDEARAAGAKPVLVTSIVRRNFTPDGKIKPDSLVPYVHVVRELAAAKRVPLIDLYALTLAQSETLGPKGSEELGRTGPDGKPDHTHLGPRGKAEIGAVAARELVKLEPALKPYLHVLVSWRDAMRQPREWYGSAEAIRIAGNLLRYQNENGGWDKNIDMSLPLTGKPEGQSTIDNGATYTQMRFLARVYASAHQQPFARAVERGLNYLLEAQYANGGWPQFYPLRHGYWDHITYNDDAMIGVMETLRSIVRKEPDYEFVSEPDRERAAKAVERGIQCILKTQVVIDGRPTVWCAQHDEKTLAPAKARAYELPSLSGSESVGIVRFLMGIDRPDAEVVRSIQNAVAWFDKAKITGIRLEKKPDPTAPKGYDEVVVSDPKAPPIWARFYEIGTHRPIFSSRDGAVKYKLDEISYERRNGYRWYVDKPARLLDEEYPKWMAQWAPGQDARTSNAPAPKPPPAAVAGIPVNYDEALTGTYTLPDPLKLQDGKPVRDAKTWNETRRPEIVKLFEENQFGRSPGRPAAMSFDVFDKGTPAMGGKALRKQVTVYFSADKNGPKEDIVIYLPAGARQPVPLLLCLDFAPNASTFDDPDVKLGEMWTRDKKRVPAVRGRGIGRMNIDKLLANGFGVAGIYYGDIDPDFPGGVQLGVRRLYLKPGQAEPGPDEWGSIGAWAWGLSRAMDYLETDSAVDSKRVAIYGVSRLGKTVMWAGAHDTRFAMVIASCSGEGGAALSRRNYGETIAHLTEPSRYPYQFAANYAKYAAHVDRFPVDAHMLVSLIAPRPVLLQTGDKDFWSDPKGEFLAAAAAEPVYRLLGKQGLGTDRMPAAGEPILHTIGYHMHAGGHGTIPSDWDVFLQFMEMHLRP